MKYMHDSNLYKYISYEVAEAIITGKCLKFDNPVNFNDPFDCVLDRISTSISDNNIDVRVNTDVNILREKFGDEFFNDWGEKELEKGYQLSQEDKLKRSAICCFSLTYENPLMWAHYANNHKGICLAFFLNTEESPFPQFPNDKLSHGSVNYPKENNIVNYLSDKTQAIKQLFFTKSAHWEYEEEYRIQVFTEPGLYKFNDNFLKGIIFGLRVSQESRERFKRLCLRSGFNNLTYQRAERIGLELKFEND
jgi:hypothetical protein